MRSTLIAVFFLFVFNYEDFAQVNVQDSLALVALYNSTDGKNWNNHDSWLTLRPVSTWHGITVTGTRVTRISLSDNGLTGSIPPEIGNLTNLQILDLEENIGLWGSSIPPELGNLLNLQYLYLSSDFLTGNVPPELGKLTNLKHLYLGDNLSLTGSIPSELGNLINLQDLDLSDNELSDTIPSSLGNLSNLIRFYLSNNHLSGSIPTSFGALTNLQIFYLDNNQLSGSIPISFGALTNLQTFDLDNNQLSDSIPASVCNLAKLYSVNTSKNRFTFKSMELLGSKKNFANIYAPQATIPLYNQNNILSVSAGGTPSNDTFRLYKDGILVATQIADSTFKITATGQYNITANNAIATQLTLYSDTTTITTLLADTTTQVIQNITGNSPTDVSNGIYKLVTLTPTAGANALNGNVTTLVTIDPVVKVYNNQPYVSRHYDIIPATNPATSQATVTLYFTQQDFDDFNSYVTTNHLNISLLPTNGVNNGNVRISQLHGTFTGSSDPGNYNDSTSVLITPTVSWDNTDQWWTVTFPVTGFSGFYLSTGNFTLPITLTSFTASKNKTSVVLNWRTANEQNNAFFAIERSNNSNNNFKEVGKLNSKGNSDQTQQYLFEDFNPFNGGNYYRLKQVDKDGKTTYSKVVFVDFGELIAIKLYPNPVKDLLTLEGLTPNIKTNISIIGLQGSVLAKTTANNSTYSWNIKQLPAGTYYVRIEAGKNVTTLKFVKE